MGLGGLPDQLAGMIVWGKLDRWQSGGEASFHQQPMQHVILPDQNDDRGFNLKTSVIRRVIRSQAHRVIRTHFPVKGTKLVTYTLQIDHAAADETDYF